MKLIATGKIKMVFAAAIILITAAACALVEPQYRTQVDYSPPTTSQGQMCLNQCDANSMQCQNNARSDYDRCEADLVLQDKECVRKAQERRNYCLRNNAPSCDVDYSNTLNLCRQCMPTCKVETRACNRQYDTCYERCGGKVTRTSVCVRNCD